MYAAILRGYMSQWIKNIARLLFKAVSLLCLTLDLPPGTLLCHWKCQVQRSLQYQMVGLTYIIEQVGVRGKKGGRRFWRETRENVVFKDVKTMSVVSDKQRQAGSSGSAPATPQGNNLPPAVPPPSISRNPLRGSKCNSLHCDYSSLPCLPYFLYHIFSLEYVISWDASEN